MSKKKQSYNFNKITKGKKTCSGELVSEIEARERKKEEFAKNMKAYITKTVADAKDINTIKTTRFLVVYANYFYKCDHYIYPAEIGIVNFTLDEGVRRIFNSLVTPVIRNGYTSEAMSISRTTHQIPVLDTAEGSKETAEVYNKIIEFLEPLRENGKLPVLYTRCEAFENFTVECLDKLREDSGHSEALTVYSLSDLAIELFKSKHGYEVEDIELFQFEKEIKHPMRDPYEYKLEIVCKFHKEAGSGGANHCAQGLVQRWILNLYTQLFALYTLEPTSISKYLAVKTPSVEVELDENELSESSDDAFEFQKSKKNKKKGLIASFDSKLSLNSSTDSGIKSEKLNDSIETTNHDVSNKEKSNNHQFTQPKSVDNGTPWNRGFGRGLKLNRNFSSTVGSSQKNIEVTNENFPDLGGQRVENTNSRRTITIGRGRGTSQTSAQNPKPIDNTHKNFTGLGEKFKDSYLYAIIQSKDVVETGNSWNSPGRSSQIENTNDNFPALGASSKNNRRHKK